MTGEILVVAEHRNGELKPATLETAAFALELAASVEGTVCGVVLGRPARPLAEKLAETSGIDVLYADHEALAIYNAEAYISSLAGIIGDRKPSYVLIPHTATGWDYAPRLAVAVNAGCSIGVNGIVNGDPPAFARQICGGKILTEVVPVAAEAARTSVVTVMPGSAKSAEPVATKVARTINVASDVVSTKYTRTLGYEEAARKDLDLSKAEVIVAAGRGVGDPDKLPVIRELAACFNKGAMGSSRPVVDAGWLPIEHQVGQTGQTVAPKLYIAAGVSGAIQHTSAMKNSGLIVAVNKDPRAMIFKVAHVGVVADLHEFLPVLIEKIRAPSAKNKKK
jgi:electron transfer flavoprotein alpha subunit